jgi:hypothetical protein
MCVPAQEWSVGERARPGPGAQVERKQVQSKVWMQ